MIRTVIRCPDDMVMVFDNEGEQIPEYQGQYHEVKERILQDSAPGTIFGHLRNFEPELRKVPREEW